MSKWSKLRKNATEAGAFHADGGDDRRDEFASRGTDLRDAYDKGFQNRERERAEQEKAESHPLRQISREANALYDRTEDSDCRDLANLVERLADYIVEKEEGYA